MLGWRKRNDGFEWRDYVRTTILVRRKQRRDRIGEAGRAAVENIKVAGQRGALAGAESAKAVGRNAINLGQQGAVVGAAGAKAVGHNALRYGREGAKLGVVGAKFGAAKVRAAMPVAGSYLQRLGAALLYALAYTWAVLRTLAGIAADQLGPLLAPLGRLLRRPNIRLAVLIVGAVALLGGMIRAYANGFERDTWIALLVGVGLLGTLALAHVATGMPPWLAARFGGGGRLRDRIQSAAGKPAVQKAFAVLVLTGFVGAAIYPWWPSAAPFAQSTHAETTGSLQEARSDVEGRGSAVTGDTLRVGSTMLRLNGIEAPLPDQMCNGRGGRQWACGEAARQALARILRSGRISCDISGSADGISTADCEVFGRDVSAQLVRAGHVFASTGILAPYSHLEREARASGAGIWIGDAVRPAEYREHRWEEAKRASPDGCPIKGNVRAGRRIYVVPWARGYEQARVVASRGERWFCSESEARQAGFRPAEQS